MRKPVVVGVTGTSAALAAVRLAAREAVARGSQLRVVHAFTWPSPGPPGAGIPYDVARRAAAQVVDEAVLTAQRSTPGVRVTGQLVDGLPDRVLLRLSRTAVLLVLGDDDLATTPWLPPASVLVQTVARSWCPVLVARGPRPPRGAVLAAVDGSPNGMLALRHAVAETRRRRAALEVVHVVREYGGRYEEAGREVLAEAADVAPAARTRLLAGAPGAALVLASRRGRVIVLGPRGAGDAGLLGTVAREVLHRGACPTVFVHGRSVPVPRSPSGRKAGAFT
ncbi:universal stress protein [Actinoplanes subtropicus]|uniref:universal stress protein n=1 Tax=Actinoplanes subtropicus TaxID=543632 RepID=UPI00146FD721|nr:universal stress protein [Actinoplanes subtropicus]